MIRKYPWLVFALVFCWKIALFIFSVQPIPANDAFFYDGAAIHKLLYGGFYNPTLVHAFPICGGKIFSGYPPLYQLPLMAWLSVFGISAKSVVALHIVLFGCYLLVLLAIFRRLRTPAWCVNLAGGFLLAITFHDRPDSLAQLFGILAVYAWIRSRRILDGGATAANGTNIWAWWMVFFEFLTLCTSLQIGGIYLLVIFVGSAAACHFDKERFPRASFLSLCLVVVGLVAFVKIACPVAWAGFVEHARQTPSLTGLRFPSFPELLKIARSVPGIILVLLLVPLSWFKQHHDFQLHSSRRHELVLLPLFVAVIAITAASLFILTPNSIGIANYFQPLLVAAYLAICSDLFPGEGWLRLQIAALGLAIVLGAVRAIGMTTWGLACASDVSYTQSNRLIEAQLASLPSHATVVMSSAFLYDGVKYPNFNLIHSDWLEKAGGDSRVSDVKGLLESKPTELVLTQFDYYRRFQAVLAEVKTNPGLQDIQVTNTAHIRAPDSYKSIQQVVQHVSWAPVFIHLSWHE